MIIEADIIIWLTEICNAEELSNNILHTVILYMYKYIRITKYTKNLDFKALGVSCLYLAMKFKSGKYVLDLKSCENIYMYNEYHKLIGDILHKFDFNLYIETSIESLINKYHNIDNHMLFLLHISLFYPHLIQDTTTDILASTVFNLVKKETLLIEHEYPSIILLQYLNFYNDDNNNNGTIQPIYDVSFLPSAISYYNNNNNNNNKKKRKIEFNNDDNNKKKTKVDDDDNYDSKYELIKQIGKGMYSTVYEAINLDTNMKVAVKDYKRIENQDSIQHESVYNELTCLKLLESSPYIMPMNQIKMNSNLDLLIEMPLCQGDLKRNYSKITNIKLCIYQLLKAVKHCHKHYIIHRDIKPENIILHENNSGNNNTASIYLSDFNMSLIERNKNHENLYQKYKGCSEYYTMNYRPPELLLDSENRFFTFKSDIWAVGCMFGYLLLKGQDFLFPGNNELELFNTVLKTINDKNWVQNRIPNIDTDAADLLYHLCQFSPNDRISAKEALSFPYFKTK